MSKFGCQEQLDNSKFCPCGGSYTIEEMRENVNCENPNCKHSRWSHTEKTVPASQPATTVKYTTEEVVENMINLKLNNSHISISKAENIVALHKDVENPEFIINSTISDINISDAFKNTALPELPYYWHESSNITIESATKKNSGLSADEVEKIYKECNLGKVIPKETIKGVQYFWTLFINEINSKLDVSSRVLKDMHATASVGMRMPDDVLYTMPLIRDENHILAVGELKYVRGSKDKFFPLEIDQIVQRCWNVLEFQPTRKFIYGYLTDSNIITFFKITRNDNNNSFSDLEYTFSQSNIFALRWHGLSILIILLNQSYEDLGFNMPTCNIRGYNLTLGKFLGSGSSCHAFKFTDLNNADANYVLKSYRTGFSCVNEKSVLTSLKNEFQSVGGEYQCSCLLNQTDSLLQSHQNACPTALNYITNFVASSEDNTQAIFTPVVESFKEYNEVFTFNDLNSMFKVQHLGQLLFVLRFLHFNEYCHRDIRHANIFINSNGQILVNDFSSCSKMGKTVSYAGASKEILPGSVVNGEHLPDASFDLFQVLCLIIRYFRPHLYGLVKKENDWLKLLELDRVLKDAYQFTLDSDYDNLFKALSSLIN